MKYLFVFLMIFSSTAFAKEYHYEWTTPIGMLEYKTKADSWKVGYERAAKFCFKWLINNVSEDQGELVIDICANPKEKK